MKQLLFTLFIIVCSSTAQAQPAITADRDSVSVVYAPCLGQTGIDTIRIRNSGDSTTIDLSLVRGDRYWSIAQNSGNRPLWGWPLSGGEEMWLIVRHATASSGTGMLRDTLRIAHETDTLLIPLISRTVEGKLRLENRFVDLGEVPIGDTARKEITIYNDGEADVILDFLPNIFVFSDLFSSDTIPAKGSRVAELTYPHTNTAVDFEQNFVMAGRCAQINVYPRVSIYHPQAHWLPYEIRDSVIGCPQSMEYDLLLRNEDSQSVKLDSVRFTLPAQDWELEGSPIDDVWLDPGGELSLRLRKNVKGKSTALTAFPAGGQPDHLTITIFPLYADPVIRNYRDTLSIDLEAGEQVALGIQLFNRAPGGYKVKSVNIEGAPEWSITPYDSTKTLGQAGFIDLVFPFSGASAGIYTATAYIQGAPCDTVLKQVLVARVLPASVESEQADNISLSISNNLVTARGISHFNYTIVSVTGVEVLRGFATEASIDVSQLAKGLYFMKLGDRDQSTVLKFFK